LAMPHGIAKKHKKSLSNRLCISVCNGFNQQIPPYFHEYNPVFNSEGIFGPSLFPIDFDTSTKYKNGIA